MDILGVGVPELAFIILIAIIVLGPRDMQKAGKTIGTWMRKVVMSPEWREIKNASNKIKSLPAELMREANPDLDEYRRDQKAGNVIPEAMEKDDYGSWAGKPAHKKPEMTNTIAPPNDEELAPVDQTESSQETPPVNDTHPIEPNNA